MIFSVLWANLFQLGEDELLEVTLTSRSLFANGDIDYLTHGRINHHPLLR